MESFATCSSRGVGGTARHSVEQLHPRALKSRSRLPPRPSSRGSPPLRARRPRPPLAGEPRRKFPSGQRAGRLFPSFLRGESGMGFSRVFLTPPSLGAPLVGLGAREVPVGLDCFAALVLGVRVLEFIFMVSKATLIIRFTFATWWSRACKWTAERRKRVVRVAEALAGFSSRSNFLESPWNCSGLKYGLERCRRYQVRSTWTLLASST